MLTLTVRSALTRVDRMLHHAKHVDLTSSATLLPQFGPAVPAFDMKADFFDALTQGNVDRAAGTFAEDGTLLFPGLRPVRGRALVKRMLSIIRRRYDEIVWTPASPLISSGEWMVTSWSVNGTFKETGLPYQNEVLSLIQLDSEGKIKLLSDYFKDTQAFHPEPLGTARRQNSRVIA